jgi:UDP-glucose:(heptosyl)LPS alpha-1,3-glucosyltransferase
MRIALVRRGYSATGGAERYLLRLAAGLAGRGHDPTLVTSPDWPSEAWRHGPRLVVPGYSPRAFADAAGPVLRQGCFDRVFGLDRLWRCDLYRAGDGVHAAWLERRKAFEPWWRCAFRALQAKHREILELEAALFHGGARRVIVNSRLVESEICERFGTPGERLELVYNGYDKPAHESTENPGHGRERTRRLLGVPTGAVMALFTGTGWQRKGLAVAARALRQLESRDLHLVVAGRGRPGGQFSGPRLHFPGPVLDMAPLYEAADLFVLPTWYDPFSNACLEAARHGLPVITTAANGFAEWIEPGIHGEVVEPGNATALAGAIGRWLDPSMLAGARAGCAENVAGLTVEANVVATLKALGC